MEVYFIQSKKVAGAQYFFGVTWCGEQVRFGLIWWHLVIYFG